jgi:hypothetical protein
MTFGLDHARKGMHSQSCIRQLASRAHIVIAVMKRISNPDLSALATFRHHVTDFPER